MIKPTLSPLDQLLPELRKLIENAPPFGVITLTAETYDGQVVKVRSGIERAYKVCPKEPAQHPHRREKEL